MVFLYYIIVVVWNGVLVIHLLYRSFALFSYTGTVYPAPVRSYVNAFRYFWYSKRFRTPSPPLPRKTVVSATPPATAAIRVPLTVSIIIIIITYYSCRRPIPWTHVVAFSCARIISIFYCFSRSGGVLDVPRVR